MIIALGQINPVVGDVCGNLQRICDTLERARERGVELVVFPELVTLGYPPKDLLLREAIIADNLQSLERISAACRGIAAIVGYVARNPSRAGMPLLNAAALCGDGQILSTHSKSLLPNYDVFDERRYFQPADALSLCAWTSRQGRLKSMGLTICEDLWNDEQFIDQQRYQQDPVEQLVKLGADLIINISASPFWVGKQAERRRIFTQQVHEHGIPLVYVNQVGGNDDLLFDGGSMVIDGEGRLLAQARAFEEELLIVDLVSPDPDGIRPYPQDLDSLIEALVLGTRDYVCKCGFQEVVVGLSGGIDSSLVAAIAVEALGSAAVHGVAMPSKYSTSHSLEDAAALAKNLGIDFRIIPIRDMHDTALRTLGPQFHTQPPDITDENLQARIRGQVLMAMSNKFGWLLLTTGNKSELAVGYCTLYGDMCGGLAVISDVAKTAVFDAARRINHRADQPIIPPRVLSKPPSAELRPDQTDQDSLPPYDQLDAILCRYVERQESPQHIIAAGYSAAVVEDVTRRVDLNEYKRRQAPPGLKVTSRAFGVGWRMPIAARFTTPSQI